MSCVLDEAGFGLFGLFDSGCSEAFMGLNKSVGHTCLCCCSEGCPAPSPPMFVLLYEGGFGVFGVTKGAFASLVSLCFGCCPVSFRVFLHACTLYSTLFSRTPWTGRTPLRAVKNRRHVEAYAYNISPCVRVAA